MNLRRVLTDIVEALVRIEEKMTANDDALAALQTAVSANTDATNAAVTALGNTGTVTDDISAGVTAAAATVQANTDALTNRRYRLLRKTRLTARRLLGPRPTRPAPSFPRSEQGDHLQGRPRQPL